MPISRLNHAVLYVRDARAHERFYRDVLGFETVIEHPGGAYVFMRAPDASTATGNHHDIAFFTIGANAEPSGAGHRDVGLYHLAWEVPTLAELGQMEQRLSEAGALVGKSDHGTNKSLYAKDPDGIEFEVMWLVPAEHWGASESQAIIDPLDIDAEIRRFSALGGRAVVTEPFGQIERRTVAEEVRHAIVDGIRAGRLRPGEALPPERELAEQFGVARTSVREAIVGLSALGVIERQGNRVRVVEHVPDVEVGVDHRKTAVRDMFETRRAIEVAIAEYACCRADDAQRAEIEALAARFGPGLELAEFRALDRAFHAAIAQACGNKVLAEVYAKVLDALFQSGDFDSLLASDVNAEAVAGIIAESAADHVAIARALVEGSVTEVAGAVTAHLDQVEFRMIEKLV